MGDVPRRFDASVIPSLDPDRMLLDSDDVSRFDAALHLKNERLTFESSKTTILAVHLQVTRKRHGKNISSLSVADVRHDAIEHSVVLRDYFNAHPRDAIFVHAFT